MKKKAAKDDFNWFNLKNYSPCALFTDWYWAEALYERVIICNAVNTTDFSGTASLYEKIVTGKIEAPKYGVLANGVYSDTDYRAFWNIDHVVQSVLPLSISDARWINEEASKSKIDFVSYQSDIDELDIPYGEEVYPVDFVMNSEGVPWASLMLNLRASDEEILEELKTFLPKYRVALNTNERSKIPRLTINKLRTYRVLEYFDIHIWLGVNKSSITDSLLSRLLFSERDDCQTYFSQTVKPFIKSVNNQEFLRSLRSKSRSCYTN